MKSENLPWPGYSIFPLYASSGKGEPLANRTRPCVHSTASWNSHSDSRTGFESGKMIGRGLSAAIVSTTGRENAPLVVESPSSAVGFTSSTICARSVIAGPV